MIFPVKWVRAASAGLMAGAALGAITLALPLRAQNPAGAAQTTPAPPTKGTPSPDKAPPKPRVVTLADALAKARLGRVGLALAVTNKRQRLTEAEAAARKMETVSQTADACNRATHNFGSVMAIGPKYGGGTQYEFQRRQRFRRDAAAAGVRLAGNPAGRPAAGSVDEQGGNRPERFDDAHAKESCSNRCCRRRSLLSRRACLLEMMREAAMRRVPPKSLGKLREKANSVRFRITQEISLQYEAQDHGQGRQRLLIPPPAGKGAPTVYDMSGEEMGSSGERVNGVTIRRDVPNQLKPSDLDYNASVLQAAISIQGLKTAGDLITRIAKQTGIELYCDPRQAKKPLAWVISGANSASASALLRALAFCLAGTYRKVGPAFVLTDDLQGAGTRVKLIQDFEEECEAERQQALQAAAKAFRESPARKSLKFSSFNDPLAPSAAQEKAAASKPPEEGAAADGLVESMALPYTDLTPQQQEAVQNFQEELTKSPAPDPDDL